MRADLQTAVNYSIGGGGGGVGIVLAYAE